MSMQRKLKTALDETRMLMMGSQILFGFQLQAVFHERFPALDDGRKTLTAIGILLMAVTIGVLIAPSCRHRLLEKGEASPTMLTMTTRSSALALLLFAASLGCDLVVVLSADFGTAIGLAAGAIMVALSLAIWFALAWVLRRRRNKEKPMDLHRETLSVTTKIEQMLTEARVILPGAQALFGFQLIVMLTPAFAKLPDGPKLAHVGALLCVVLAIILLMAPAAIHRISFDGEDNPRMLHFGSGLVTAALLPLSLGLAGDIMVAVGQSLGNATLGIAAGGGILILLLGIWYAWPLLLRLRAAAMRREPASARRS
ncbi:DUF6328 family protein [Dongia sp.]|uniref:DUF6328 family protein n=1 Tax=Dongia sp. TaxID=1977262 RepID=UPI0037539393